MATNAERIETATAQAEAASQVMDDFTRFDDVSDVTNQDAETFSSLQKLVKNSQDTIDAIGAQILASQAEAEGGVENSKVMTALRTLQAIDAHRPYASTAEAEAGVEDTKVMTSAKTKEAITAQAITAQMIGKNLIMNSGLNVDIEGNKAGTTANATHVVESWVSGITGSGTLTSSTVKDTGGEADISLKLEATVADASLAVGDLYTINQKLEGWDVNHLAIGTATPETVTLKFRVWASLIGKYSVAFRNGAVDRSYVAEYEVLVADTWEDKEITVTLDTTGTWSNQTATGLYLSWVIASGSTHHIPSIDTWTAGNYLASSNQVNAMGTINNVVQIKRVKLEVGTVATKWEMPNYATELEKGHRYFQIIGNKLRFASTTQLGNQARPSWMYPVAMRVSPTNTITTLTSGSGATLDSNSLTSMTQDAGNTVESTFTIELDARL